MKASRIDASELTAHSAFVRGVARAVLGADDEIEDVVQDTWVAALGSSPRRPGRIKAWLGGIARRQAALRIRSRVRARRHLQEAARRQGDANDGPGAADARARAHAGRRVVDAVLALPDIYRDVVLLRYLDEQPPRVVAEDLGVPVETVRTRTRRALDLLRTALARSETGFGTSWRAAVLPLAGGGFGDVASTSPAVAKAIAALTLATLVVGGTLLWRPWSPPRSSDAVPVTETGDSMTPVAPRLAGTATQPAAKPRPPLGGEILDDDFLTLVRRVRYRAEARDILVAQARADPAVTARLLDWLRSVHDCERAVTADGARVVAGGWYDIRALFQVLAAIGPDTVPLLADRLDDPNPFVQERAIHALAWQAGQAAPAVPALLARLETGAGFEVAILGAFVCMGHAAAEALPAFTARLRDDRFADPERAAAARGVLYVAPITEATLEACAVALRDGSFEVMRNLLPEVAKHGPACASLAGELRAVILEPDTHDLTRADALLALARAAPDADATRKALLHVLVDVDADEDARHAAARGLTALGKVGHTALLKATRGLGSLDRLLVARAVAEGVGANEIDAVVLLEVLDPLREEEDENLRMDGIELSGPAIGKAAFGVDWIGRWLDDPAPCVRRTAMRLLEYVPDPGGAIPDLAYEAFDDDDEEVRRLALAIIRSRAANPSGARARAPRRVEDVLRLTRDEDLGVRYQAALLLDRVAPERSVEALPVWIDMLASPYYDHIDAACGVLERLGPQAEGAAGALRATLARKWYPQISERIQRALDAVTAE